METLINAFFNLGILRETAPYLWAGFRMSVLLTLVVVPLGIAGGLGVALVSQTGSKPLRWLVVAYVDLFRAFPPLVLLMFIAFGLPFTGLDLPAFAAVALAFLLNTSSYYGEIFRAGIESIPRGQFEGATALGLGYWRAMGFVILPQALRLVIPGIVNSFIALFKDTTLVLIVAIFDLLGQLRAAFADPNWATPVTLFTGFAFAGMIYFLVSFGMSRYALFMERRLNVQQSR